MTDKEFLEKVNTIFDEGDAKCIQYALEFAVEKHEGQFRLSGEPYIIHPIMVASFLMNIGMDAEAIMAALLHDTIEDTDATEEEVKTKFGSHVAFLVTSVTKLSTFKSNNNSNNSLKEAQAENFRNLIMSMFTDMRVLLIKLADRLHNMKTLEFQTPEKQKRIAQETLDIYAPLAGRLGISTYKVELEDIAMKYVYPDEYKELSGAIVEQREVRNGIVDGILEEIKGKLVELKINGEVFGRPKHMYSIFKKMRDGNKTLDQIYDLIAVRVIVNTVTECYTVLGAIHSLWKPIPGRFKDYISMPKPNLYQSIHTTVVSNFGQIFEIQIRTYEMHKIAEYGIAAHWKYKEGDFNAKKQLNYGKELRWIREVREVEGELKNSQEFVDTIKSDVLVTDIYVFSPKGDVFSMAKGATCLDFAYRVHSAVGDKCVGAKVNGKMVNIDYELQNGDVIEILTSQSSKGPSRDWLKIVKTPTARAKIRSFFKNSMKEENIKNGRDILEREAKRRGYNLYEELMQSNWVDIIMDKYSFSSLDDLYASVGYGGITSGQVLGKLVEFFKKEQAYQQKQENALDIVPEYASSRKHHGVGISVEGYDDFLVHLSQCCNPVPGDEIIGYISKGRGVSIHRADCSNMRNVPKERLINVSWPDEDKPVNCVASLRIESVNTSGLLGQITSAIGALKIQITAANVRLNKNTNKAIIEISLEIKNLQELEMIISKLSNIQGVLSISRKQ